MILKVNKEKFKKCLSDALNFTNKTNKLPTLSNILIEINENQILFTGTDLTTEGTIILSEDFSTDSNDIVFTESYKLFDILKLSEKDEITLETKETSLIIREEGSYYELYTYNPEDFSKFDLEFEELNEIILPTEKLIEVLKKTTFPIQTSSYKPFLTGLFIKKYENKVVFFGADNYRLSNTFLELKNENLNNDFKIIIPKKTCQLLLKFLNPSNNQETKIYYSDKYVKIDLTNIIIKSKLIEDKYPEESIENILNSSFPINLEINKNEFFKTLKKSSIFLEESKTIAIEIKDNQITFFSEESTKGRSKNTLNIKYNKTPLKFGIIPNHIFDLENLIEGNIIFNFPEPDEDTYTIDQPILIEDSEDKKFKYFIQPIDI